MPPNEKRGFKWKKQYTELLNYSTVGIEMGAAVGIGVAIGYYLEFKVLDGRYAPGLTLFFMALGGVAAGKAFYRAAKDLRSKSREKDDSGDNRP